MNEQAKDTRLSEATPDPWIGKELSGYRIDSVIGRGGMGVVYKATQLSLDRPVAIKVIPAAMAEHPQFVERFHREVDILSKLSHPNVVTVFERGECEGRLYLVMEYVDGTSLRDVMKAGPLPKAEALSVVRSVLQALEHAHEKGIVHRDIKPENVLVAPGGIVKVADFGLSRLLGPQDLTRLTHTHLLLGTFEYMAPEQREKAKEADERSDIYATGVVLYEMLAGELPIGNFDALSAKRPRECDARIDDIVSKSLHKAPEKRFQKAAEMGHAVSRLLSTALLPEEPKPKPKPLRRAPRRRPAPAPKRGMPGWAIALIVCGFLGLAALLGFVYLFLWIGRAVPDFPAEVDGPRLTREVPEFVEVGLDRRLTTVPAGIDYEELNRSWEAQSWVRKVAGSTTGITWIYGHVNRALSIRLPASYGEKRADKVAAAYQLLCERWWGVTTDYEERLRKWGALDDFNRSLAKYPVPKRKQR